jgi:hypothetical protein
VTAEQKVMVLLALISPGSVAVSARACGTASAEAARPSAAIAATKRDVVATIVILLLPKSDRSAPHIAVMHQGRRPQKTAVENKIRIRINQPL